MSKENGEKLIEDLLKHIRNCDHNDGFFEKLKTAIKHEDPIVSIRAQEIMTDEDKLKSNAEKQVRTQIYKKEYVKELNKQGNKKTYNAREEQFFLITINPKECEIKDLKSIIRIIESKKQWIDIHSYVFEQRSETEENMGKGKHIHLLTNKTYKKSYTIDFLAKSLKLYCKKESIDIQVIEKYDLYNTESYMRGKKSMDKMKKVKIDKIWRKENNIEDIYVFKSHSNFIDEDDVEEKEKDINCTYAKQLIDNEEYFIFYDEKGQEFKCPIKSIIFK